MSRFLESEWNALMVRAMPQYDTAGGNTVADKRVVLRYRLNNDLNGAAKRVRSDY